MARKIVITLDELLEKKDMTQKQLKQILDRLVKEKYKDEKKTFRAAAISELYNNQRKSINKEHLELIADALEIDEITDLIKIINE